MVNIHSLLSEVHLLISGSPELDHCYARRGSDPAQDNQSTASARDKETSMSAPRINPDQVLADDVALAIFRRRGFTLAHLHMHHLMAVPVAEELVTYDRNVVSKIARAMPSEPVTVEGGYITFDMMIDRFAAAVIMWRIQHIVSINSRFGEQGDGHNWIYLGGMRRNLRDLPLTPMQLAIKEFCEDDDEDFVDLWGGSDGRQVKVVFGCGSYDYLSGHITQPRSQADGHVREAFRRLGLLIPVAV